MSDENKFEDESLLKFWCLGTVTRDKPFGTDTIMATPSERDTMQKGDPSRTEDKVDEKVETPSGVAGGQMLSGGKEMPAKWMPDGDNFVLTSPMVRVGESVKLYKYADKDEIYWKTVFREPSLRRTERFVIGAGNLSEPGESYDLDSSYTIDVDTIDKAIRIKTTHSDGEKFSYGVEIIPSESVVKISDNVGNVICLDSENSNCWMEDISGGRIETRDGHPRIFGPKGIQLETPAQVEIKAGDVLIDSGNNVVKGGTKFTDAVTMESTLALNGNFTMGGGSGGGATATFSGQIRLQGSLDVTGTGYFGGYVTLAGGHTGE